MGASHRFLNRFVAAFLLGWISAQGALAADEARLDELFSRLQAAEPADARRIAKEIEHEFTKSGSPAMDLLLRRGREALEAGETRAAIEHLTALTDHAPGFAEGWHMRAVAFARQEMFGPALADLKRALSLRPRHFAAIFSLGSIMQELNRPEMARRAFTRALAIHPHYEPVTKALDTLGSQDGGKTL
jgi:tetratricopeptide (TPR) repeat protein